MLLNFGNMYSRENVVAEEERESFIALLRYVVVLMQRRLHQYIQSYKCTTLKKYCVVEVPSGLQQMCISLLSFLLHRHHFM